MDPNDLLPGLTASEAVMQMVGILVYAAIGIAGLAQAPGDERTRVFCGLALLNGLSASVPVVFWSLGITNAMAAGRWPIAIMFASLGAATLALFHLSQVFPTRRAWIRHSGPQLPIAYALTPIAVVFLMRMAPFGDEQASNAFMMLAITFGFPLIILNGLVLPIATIVGFLRSFREAAPGGGVADARPALAGFLMSVLIGTALAVLALGPLEAVAPDSPATLLVRVTVWMFGLLLPAAYAAGIWRYRVLEIPLDKSVEMEPQ